MLKSSTTLNKTDLSIEQKCVFKTQKLEPSESTLRLILQFSRTYRINYLNENQHVELFLN
jgi:hypothetical protein